jgi:hydrogenase expression/formation protein HypD
MKYLDEYRNQDLVRKLVTAIRKKSRHKIRIMEVCGGHTLAIHKFGINHLLPDTIELLSGPGCPVCVTGREAIDATIALALKSEVIITTYGDLIRVPGSKTSLNEIKARGADIRIIYSILDALEIAKAHPEKKIIFPGIGFETTTPSSAVAILEAQKQGLSNFYLLSLHKVMPPAMAALIDQGIRIDGYIGPGHVTTIAGANMYRPLVEKYHITIVISGFEPVDLLQSILMLVTLTEEKQYGIHIQYKRAVTPEGNIKAMKLVNQVFEPTDDTWRGLGNIPGSGLKIRREFSQFDARTLIDTEVKAVPEPPGCLCGEVLRGLKKPDQCTLFGKICTPSNPVGACMVSGEGACQAFYKYRIPIG